MKRLVTSVLIACLTVSIGACPFNPTHTTVELVNNGSFPVDVTMYVGSSQYTAKELLRLFGEEIERTVLAGQTVQITRECDDLQAVFIDEAELQVVGGAISPEADTDVLRDGSDFGCGDTIRFEFSHPLVPISLDIDVSYPG